MNDLPEIRKRLDALRRRIAAALALDGGARVAAVLLVAVLSSFLLDRVFRLEVPARAVILQRLRGHVSGRTEQRARRA